MSETPAEKEQRLKAYWHGVWARKAGIAYPNLALHHSFVGVYEDYFHKGWFSGATK